MELQYEITLLEYESEHHEDNGDTGEVITRKEDDSMLQEIEFEKPDKEEDDPERDEMACEDVLDKKDKIQQDEDCCYNREDDKDKATIEKSMDNRRHHKRKIRNYNDDYKDDCEQHESNRSQRIMIKDVNDEWHDALFLKEVYTKITSANRSKRMIQRRKKDLVMNFSDKEEKERDRERLKEKENREKEEERKDVKEKKMLNDDKGYDEKDDEDIDVKEKEVIKSDEGPSINWRERSSSYDCVPEDEDHHYALFMGEKCKIYPTFSIPVNNGRNGHSGMTREEEIGEVEKQNVMNKRHEHEKYKTEFLNKYFEKLNISSNKPDWNILILQAMKFNDFRDCKALLDMLEDVDYFLKYKYYLEIAFDSMIEWFLKEKLKIHSRPLPAMHQTIVK